MAEVIITETITFIKKKYNTTTYNFNEKVMILCIKIQNTTNLKFKT